MPYIGHDRFRKRLEGKPWTYKKGGFSPSRNSSDLEIEIRKNKPLLAAVYEEQVSLHALIYVSFVLFGNIKYEWYQ